MSLPPVSAILKREINQFKYFIAAKYKQMGRSTSSINISSVLPINKLVDFLLVFPDDRSLSKRGSTLDQELIYLLEGLN